MFIFTVYIGGILNSISNFKDKDSRLTITKNIDYELDNPEFHSRSKDGKIGMLTRDRKFTLRKLIVFIMLLNKAIQRDLDSFFKKIDSSDYTIRQATKGAFTQARSKINEWGFKRLNEIACDSFYESSEYYVWYEHRLLAVDGSRLMLPNHKTIKEEFGECSFGPNSDSKRSMALVSMLYDVLNQVTVDAQIAPFKSNSSKKSSEQSLLQAHMPRLKAGDLLLLDRGYPSKALFFQLKAQKVDFCVRMKGSWWNEVRSFRESTEKERIITFELPKKDEEKLSDYPDFSERTIKCRLLKIELDTGEIEILCTSLLDTEKYPYEDFKELYHLRWNEEEAYKLLKNRIELENFTGKTAKAVKQDLFAKIFLMTLTAAYAYPVEERVKEEFKADKNRKHPQKINRTNAIAKTRDILVGIFIKKDTKRALKSFDNIVFNTREIVRPNRKNERKHRQKKQYSMNYKRL